MPFAGHVIPELRLQYLAGVQGDAVHKVPICWMTFYSLAVRPATLLGFTLCGTLFLWKSRAT